MNVQIQQIKNRGSNGEGGGGWLSQGPWSQLEGVYVPPIYDLISTNNRRSSS